MALGNRMAKPRGRPPWRCRLQRQGGSTSGSRLAAATLVGACARRCPASEGLGGLIPAHLHLMLDADAAEEEVR